MKILFQGDSITDVGRNTNSGSLLSIGQGYPCLIASRLGADEPGKYEFVNRGISGNRIVDVYARIKADCWNLEPDLLSVLIGVNDVWHEFAVQNGVDADRFYAVYKMLVCDTKERLPGIILDKLSLAPLANNRVHVQFITKKKSMPMSAYIIQLPIVL